MRVWTCALLGLIATASPAYSQQPSPQAPAPAPAVSPLPPEPEGVTLTPFVGVAFGGDFESSPASFGAALGYGMNSRISVEGELGFVPDAEQGLIGEVDSTVWTLSGNVLYHFVARNVTPYATGGLGLLAAHTDAEETGLVDDDTSYEFTVNFGAGLKAALSDRFGLRGDLRYFLGDDLAPDHWRLYGGVVIRRIGR